MDTNKQLTIVSYEQAKRLKELGFNWGCEYAYRWSPQALIKLGVCAETINAINDYASAPTVALALKWFRDEKSFDYSIIKGRLPSEYTYTLLNGEIGRLRINGYEATESLLLNELLTILEKEI